MIKNAEKLVVYFDKKIVVTFMQLRILRQVKIP